MNGGGLTVEVRGLIYLGAPFVGFSKTLNGLSTANEVFKERGISLPLPTQGTVTEADRAAKGAALQQPLYGDEILKALQGLPDGLGDEVARSLPEYCFCDFYTRGGLSLDTTELLIYAILFSIVA